MWTVTTTYDDQDLSLISFETREEAEAYVLGLKNTRSVYDEFADDKFFETLSVKEKTT